MSSAQSFPDPMDQAIEGKMHGGQAVLGGGLQDSREGVGSKQSSAGPNDKREQRSQYKLCHSNSFPHESGTGECPPGGYPEEGGATRCSHHLEPAGRVLKSEDEFEGPKYEGETTTSKTTSSDYLREGEIRGGVPHAVVSGHASGAGQDNHGPSEVSE